jgi:formate hydrogenlyase subunit 4
VVDAVNALVDLLHVAILFLMPPLLIGVVNRTKARFAGRHGPPLFQAYADLYRLFRKGSVFSTTTSWVFKAGPVVGFVGTLSAALIIPIAGHRAPIAFFGDLIFLAYVLALGRFFTVIAALDTGSPFEGMGAAREATFAALAEPAFVLALLVPAAGTKTLSMSAMLGTTLSKTWSTAPAPLVLVTVSMFIVLLVENCRIPFDDPNTHLELTMIHEVMILDHSGPALGMILYSASLKLFVFGALIAGVAFPLSTGSALLDLLLFAAEMIGLAIVVGIVESVMARLRMIQIPNLLIGACILSALGIIYPTP